jgi:SAM-dependent methyltransferase
MTIPTPTPQGSDWFWSDYWRSGQQACCFNVGGENYGPQITKVWTDFFETLPPTARILDLCTGNGAIAIIGAEIGLRRGAAFQVHGVDRAEIHVEKTRLFRPNVHGVVQFQSGVATEALPFEDSSFDSVVGQYAIEYTDLARTIPEIGRVTAPEAKLQFVTHARDGAVLSSAEGELAGTQFLDEMGILGATRTFIVRAGTVDRAGPNATPDERQSAGEVANHLNMLLKSLDDGIKLLNAPIFLRKVKQSIADVLTKRHAVSPEIAAAKIDELGRSIEAHRQRLIAMMKAAQDERGARAIATMLSSTGFKVEQVAPLRIADNRLFGWQINATKSA